MQQVCVLYFFMFDLYYSYHIEQKNEMKNGTLMSISMP